MIINEKTINIIARSKDNKETSRTIHDIKPGQQIKLDIEVRGESGKLEKQRSRGFGVIDITYHLKQ